MQMAEQHDRTFRRKHYELGRFRDKHLKTLSTLVWQLDQIKTDVLSKEHLDHGTYALMTDIAGKLLPQIKQIYFAQEHWREGSRRQQTPTLRMQSTSCR